MKEIKDFVFCKNRKCPHTECFRHNANTPFNIVVTRVSFEEKKGKCAGYLYEENGIPEWSVQE